MNLNRNEVWQLMCAVYDNEKREDGKCFDPLYLKLREKYAKVLTNREG